ncbi:MAG: helix-turn-helix domain-containing protein [Oscillospiraceae bacterium]|jgi:transcriptional regulator with XRE-family HTH domain|nr:helix-turn-helix domain-containing protein [Oscillospiraceae bacterium]
MTNDFPRILSLLRKESNLSQKQVAIDLGVAQALLSHYEKGKRECGLDFLVKAADYYRVSTDYMLGRSPVPGGAVISESDISTPDFAEEGTPAAALSALPKKVIIGAIEIIYSQLCKIGNTNLIYSVSQMLSLGIYRVFRLLYMCNLDNDPNLFSIDGEVCQPLASTAATLHECHAAESVRDVQRGADKPPLLTTFYLEREYKNYALLFLNLIKNCENEMKKLKDIK